MKLPGFIDSHLHVLGMGYVASNVDLTKAKSIEEMVQLLSSKHNKSIIVGRGWNQEQFDEGKMPDKYDLNRVSSSKPVIAIRTCGHILVVNDAMLKLAGLTKKTAQIEGGFFDIDKGIFKENAISLIYSNMPKPTKDDLKSYFLLANDILVSQGITHVASDDFCVFDIDYKVIIDVLEELYNKGLMNVKITEQVNLPIDQFQKFIDEGYANKIIHSKFKMGPLKILADGSLGGRTAALNQPYSDEPSEQGILTYRDDDLYRLICLADQHNMDSVIHAIGDRAAKQVVGVLEKCILKSQRKIHHHALIHAQLLDELTIKQMQELGIGAIVQPIFMNSDINMVKSRLGTRCPQAYPFKTLFNSVNLGFSSDAPIETSNPFHNIYSAMTFKSIKHPEFHSFSLKQQFTLEESLKAYYKNNLVYVYEKSLPEGDYTIIDRDLRSCSKEEIKEIKVIKTVIDGVEVFRKKEKVFL